MKMRINKYISDAGLTSRRKADDMVKDGRVTIDGEKAVIGSQVEEGQDVRVDGEAVHLKEIKSYLLFNKPVGVITTTDGRYRDNIMDALVKAGWPLEKERVFPVGRLDVASSGLILMTNDSSVADKMLRATGGHEKEYEVVVDKELNAKALKAMAVGLRIMGKRTLPAKVKRLGDDRFSIAIVEGRNRQIRRMCEALGYRVLRLERVRIMHMHLKDLRPGAYRLLTEEEIMELKDRVGV